MPLVAATSFLAHRGPVSRRFEKHEEVPDEWAEVVGNKDLLVSTDEVAPEPDEDSYPVNGSVDEILGWVTSASTDSETKSRAGEALGIEEDGKSRSTLMAPLREILGTD